MAAHTPVLTSVVHDGDTIMHTLTIHLATRVLGVDTPELGNPEQHEAALAVKAAVEGWIASHKVLIDPTALSWDKFGGRIDQDLYGVAADGTVERLSSFLISNGLARPYMGEKKKEWTPAELRGVTHKSRSLTNKQE